jgi:tetratricopeptide (TPR) repeat protein
MEAKAALDRSDPDALQMLTALEREEPGYGDTAALITIARATVRVRARAAFEEGTRLEAQNNLPEALNSYERALRLDPEYAEARSAEAALRQKIKVSADETFRKASVEDAFGRADRAVTLYKRVVELLPDGDPTREKAEARLTALQVNKP